MKKISGWILKILGGLILLILLLLFTLPAIFKGKIKSIVEQSINESVNAKVTFSDYSLSFFRNFPNLSFSLNDVSVTGTEKFEGDTLAGFSSFSLVFNLASLLGSSGYEVKSVLLDKAIINAIVLEDGTANWDIVKDTTATVTEEEETSSSAIKVQLKRFEISQSRISYTDLSSKMEASLSDLNFLLSGNMALSQTNLNASLKIGEVNFIMEDVKYLNRATVDAVMDISADLEKMKFSFNENYFSLNDLRLNFSGSVSMPGDDIETDIQFGTSQTSFKTLLSLVPAIYMRDYEGLSATGEFLLKGEAKGIYSEADSTLPDIKIDLAVNNGVISYPDLPEKITAINMKLLASVDGKNLDGTTADLERFHFELAGSPFDMTFSVKSPISDPDFKGSLNGKIDLSALTKAIPLDSIALSGIIDMSLKLAGRLSMVEKEEYDKFQASGSLGISKMLVAMTGYPEVRINDASFNFTPAFAELKNANLNVGEKSDFRLAGKIENYIPYIFSDETVRGKLSLNSDLVDASDILSKMASDTSAVEDTAALAVIQVPKNINFDFNAAIKKFSYDNIKGDNLKGHIIVKDGILSIRETGLNILGGAVTLNADYDTRDTLNPMMKADFAINNIGVKDAYNTFNTIQKLAPAAEGIEGKINVNLTYESILDADMMPVVNTIEGFGKLQSDEVTLVKSAAYDKMKEVLKLSDKYSNTFRDINVSFKISKGRVYVSPFDVKVGNIKMNIGGDQGLDQTMNYLIKTEIPRADLGSSVNSLIDNLSSLASSVGVKYKPSDIIKINVKVSGVFGKPVVMPVFGSGSGEQSSAGAGSVKESVKQLTGGAVDQGKEKLRQEAESKGDKLIQEAEARAVQIRVEAAKAAEKVKQEAAVQGQKLVDEAIARGIPKIIASKAGDKVKQEADKRANQLTLEADNQANKLVEEAKAQKQALIEKL